MDNPCGPIIYSYTRAQAISDGILADISDIAKEEGFRYPTAVSSHLYYEVLNPSDALAAQGQSLQGRIWDMLTILRLSIKTQPDTSRLTFSPLFVMAPDSSPVPITIVSTVGPGDQGEPVLTLYLPGDD
jgi:hypothetical protein